MTGDEQLTAPFPWFGGKRRCAELVWERFGDVRNYVEPFAGSLAVLLGRPHAPRVETVNDLDCYVANFWRAVATEPNEVAQWADAPVNEADLQARHTWLVGQAEFRARMMTDPHYFDVKIAGWWCWGLSCWIGGGWCALPRAGHNVHHRRPQITAGKSGGVQSTSATAPASSAVGAKMPAIHTQGGTGVGRRLPQIDAMGRSETSDLNGLLEWFRALRRRLRRVRVCCGDWQRVMGPTPTGRTGNVPDGFVTAILLDPPYAGELRAADIYAVDSGTVSTAVRAWALDHGDDPRLRIALCGYEGEHLMPATWECVAWKASGGYSHGDNGNAQRERIWLSPHCLRACQQGELFA
jgi:hypothetical protein